MDTCPFSPIILSSVCIPFTSLRIAYVHCIYFHPVLLQHEHVEVTFDGVHPYNFRTQHRGKYKYGKNDRKKEGREWGIKEGKKGWKEKSMGIKEKKIKGKRKEKRERSL